MKLTGHKTRSVFNRYNITNEEDLAEAARKLQAGQVLDQTGVEPDSVRFLKSVMPRDFWSKGLIRQPLRPVRQCSQVLSGGLQST